MFRKITIAFTAAAAITTVALAPTSASAHWSGGHGFGFGHGFCDLFKAVSGAVARLHGAALDARRP